jgi:hypothetical protein
VRIEAPSARTVITERLTMPRNRGHPKVGQTDATRYRRYLPILQEVFLTLILGRRPLKITVFVASITNEFILWLDILRAYDASVDLGCQTLRLAEEELSLWSPGAGSGLPVLS